jgi:hypothetical protein
VTTIHETIQSTTNPTAPTATQNVTARRYSAGAFASSMRPPLFCGIEPVASAKTARPHGATMKNWKGLTKN